MNRIYLVAALLALSLTACGEKPATQPVETPPAVEAPAPAPAADAASAPAEVAAPADAAPAK